MQNCVIIDDESYAVDIIINHINRTPNLNLLFSTTDPVAGHSYIQENVDKIDILFLDIEMNNLPGTSLIKLIPNKISTIFTTAYDKYAVEAFALGAKAYLLKPISYEIFLTTIIRLTTNNIPVPKPDYFFISSDKKIIKINIKDVIHVMGQQNFLGITCINGYYLSTNTFKEIEEYLTEPNFIRVNKSHIIAFSSILCLEGNDVRILIEKLEKNGTYSKVEKLIPIGKTYKDHFLSLINRI